MLQYHTECIYLRIIILTLELHVATQYNCVYRIAPNFRGLKFRGNNFRGQRTDVRQRDVINYSLAHVRERNANLEARSRARVVGQGTQRRC